MNEADLEELHYRGQIRYVLDGLVAGKITLQMALPGLKLLFPVRADPFEVICQTTLTLMLQDLAETPSSLGDTVTEILGMVLEEVRHQARMRALSAAIAALEARGRTITQINSFGRFCIDGTGSFSVDDILDAAER